MNIKIYRPRVEELIDDFETGLEYAEKLDKYVDDLVVESVDDLSEELYYDGSYPLSEFNAGYYYEEFVTIRTHAEQQLDNFYIVEQVTRDTWDDDTHKHYYDLKTRYNKIINRCNKLIELVGRDFDELSKRMS